MAQYVQHDRPREELTPAEVQTMKNCLSSSIWTHSAPAGIGSAILLKFLETKGYKFRIWLRASFIVSSAIMGRFAAIPKCIRQVTEQVPDGALARQMDKMRSRERERDLGFPAPQDSYSPEPLPGSDYEPINNQLPQVPTVPLGQQQSYDDLRRKNREDFMNRRTGQLSGQTPREPMPGPFTSPEQPLSDPIYSMDQPSPSPYYDPPSPYVDSHPTSSGSNEEVPKFRRPQRVNKYGDVIDD